MLSWNWCPTCWHCFEAGPNTHNRRRMFGLLAAQQQEQPTPPPPPGQQPIFRGGTELVTAPVLVLDRDGNYVNGLQPFQFHLFDNGKEQNIQVDVAYQPISLVICLQVNSNVEGVIP